MALQSIIDISVDFYDKKYILINAKQLDKKSRFISVTCYNHGVIFPINAGQHSAYIRYKKPDGYGVFNFCNINSKGKILVELTEQMLASAGISYVDLVIVNKGEASVDTNTGEIVAIDNASILSTMTFCIDVQETAVENSEIESSYEFNGLNEALEKSEAEYTEVIRTAKSYAVGNAGGIRENEDTDNAKYYYQQSLKNANNSSTSASAAAKSEESASTSAYNAAVSADKASVSEKNALASANSAATSAENASNSENASKGYSISAQSSMTSASESASSASTSAENAQGYYLQAEVIVNGLNGAFLPKGTITYAELLSLKESGVVAAGYLYNISDDFVTDENFRVSGKVCGAGTSVYYTVDDQFDVFVGATVAGVKGEMETEYRTGMVNITSENIGAISIGDMATLDEVKSYLNI